MNDDIWKCLKRVFKTSKRLLFILFIINQYFTPNVLLQKTCAQSKQEAVFLVYSSILLLSKNMCSKQVGGCFLVYSSLIKALIFYYEKCVFEASGSCFLVYSSTVLFWKICARSKRGAAVLADFFIVHRNTWLGN